MLAATETGTAVPAHRVSALLPTASDSLKPLDEILVKGGEESVLFSCFQERKLEKEIGAVRLHSTATVLSPNVHVGDQA